LKKTKIVNVSAIVCAMSWVITWLIFRVYAPIETVVLSAIKMSD